MHRMAERGFVKKSQGMVCLFLARRTCVCAILFREPCMGMESLLICIPTMVCCMAANSLKLFCRLRNVPQVIHCNLLIMWTYLITHTREPYWTAAVQMALPDINIIQYMAAECHEPTHDRGSLFFFPDSAGPKNRRDFQNCPHQKRALITHAQKWLNGQTIGPWPQIMLDRKTKNNKKLKAGQSE